MRHICSDHFLCEDLKALILERVDGDSEDGDNCHFCNEEEGKLISIDLLAKLVKDRITSKYGQPSDVCLEYDNDNKDPFNCEKKSTRELIEENVFVNEQDIIELIITELKDIEDLEWAEIGVHEGKRRHELNGQWRSFCDNVKYKMRYMFAHKEHERNYGIGMDILYKLELAVSDLDLFREVDIESALYRCRQHTKDEVVENLESLAAPPIKYCVSENRMSPAGISMFYGAFDKETAKLEVIDEQQKDKRPLVSIGKFHLKEKVWVLDLTDLPPLEGVSIFKTRQNNDEEISFLKKFIEIISQPYSLDDKVHIEYVPTQIVTEYFRHIAGPMGWCDGIIYQSSKGNGSCIVLFMDAKDCMKRMILQDYKTEEIEL